MSDLSERGIMLYPDLRNDAHEALETIMKMRPLMTREGVRRKILRMTFLLMKRRGKSRRERSCSSGP